MQHRPPVCQSKPSSPFSFCVQTASRVIWPTLFTKLAYFSSAFSARFTSFTREAWIFLIITGPRSKASVPIAAIRGVKCSHLLASGFCSQDHCLKVSSRLLGVLPSFSFLFFFHSSEPQVVRHRHYYSMVIVNSWSQFESSAEFGQFEPHYYI